MTTITIKPNPDDIRDALALFEFVGGNSDHALNVAINKTIPKVATGQDPRSLSQQVRQQVRLAARYVKGKLTITKSYRSTLSGKISTPYRGTLLSRYEYGAKAALIGGLVIPDTPIKVKVKPTGRAQVVENPPGTREPPFLFRLKGTREDGDLDYGIGFFRTEAGPKGGRIEALYGPSVSQVIASTKQGQSIQARASVYAGEELQLQLLDAARYLLQKQYPS